jgi:hypothetical protein
MNQMSTGYELLWRDGVPLGDAMKLARAAARPQDMSNLFKVPKGLKPN